MKIRNLILALALSLVFLGQGFGQTTLTSTTVSEAVDAEETSINVASLTGVVAGDLAYIDREAMFVRSVDSTNTLIVVVRGYDGTLASKHTTGETIWHSEPANFIRGSRQGACTAGSEYPNFAPLIDTRSGTHYECLNSEWEGNLLRSAGDITVSFVQGAAPADALDTIFFVADRKYRVTDIDAVWGTAESTGAMDIQVDRLQGTEACGSGDNLLNAVLDATATANTVLTGTLTTTKASLLLAVTDRLCVDLTATPNEVANMVVTVGLTPN